MLVSLTATLRHWPARPAIRWAVATVISAAAIVMVTGVGPVSASRFKPVQTGVAAEPSTASPGADALDKTRYGRRGITDIFGTPDLPAPRDPALVALGRSLFHEPRLSVTGTVSCATCHVLADGGGDNRARSVGVSGTPTARNSPSVFNLDGQVAYFWDGRAATLSEQIEQPLHHPDEMATSWTEILATLSQDPAYAARFQDIFTGPPTRDRVKEAIIAFELTLTTADAPFDDYLAGNDSALTGRAMAGLRHFIKLGCASCHQGPLLGGNMFQRLGVFRPYPHGEGAEAIFKVPSLRNVSLSAPYFHDGSIATLGQAVRIMGRHQLGHEITIEEESALVAFLESLTSGSLSTGTLDIDAVGK